ncbi:hypothetical protein EVAR_61275_1 [Eumeta japonica]|uniref:Uncharacterized protein n=1 Tax=Eumeta variegata TaxID=151549 RepID=A0A4C1Z931_EUMVA|nr:hypothetical protein EVAR_61275_1 [Eumeta japonica]
MPTITARAPACTLVIICVKKNQVSSELTFFRLFGRVQKITRNTFLDLSKNEITRTTADLGRLGHVADERANSTNPPTGDDEKYYHLRSTWLDYDHILVIDVYAVFSKLSTVTNNHLVFFVTYPFSLHSLTSVALKTKVTAENKIIVKGEFRCHSPYLMCHLYGVSGIGYDGRQASARYYGTVRRQGQTLEVSRHTFEHAMFFPQPGLRGLLTYF